MHFSRVSGTSWFLRSYRGGIALLLLGVIALAPIGARADLLHGNVRVSPVGVMAQLGPSNQSRAVGADATGVIYVAYTDGTQVQVARSINRGQSFTSSTAIPALAGQAVTATEIAVSSTGHVYVGLMHGNGIAVLNRSTDGGATYTPVLTAQSGNSISGMHVATDGHYIYFAVAGSGGVDVHRSSDNGDTFNMTPVAMSIAYFNILVDPVNGDVVVAADTPDFHVRVSQDHGVTFATEVNPAGQVYYSHWALSSGPGGRYLIVAGSQLGGSGDNGRVVNIDTLASVNPGTFGSTEVSQSRSLFADNCGNVVDSWNSSGGSRVQVSNDLATSFGPTYTIAGATNQNTAINPAQGDVLVVYQSGNEVFLNTYANEVAVGCYQPGFAELAIDFGNIAAGTTSAQHVATLRNLSATPVQITAIDTTGEFALVSTSCVGTLAAEGTCLVPLTFTPTSAGYKAGQLRVQTSETSRVLPLSGTAFDHTLEVGVVGDGSVSAAVTPVPLSGAIEDCTADAGDCLAHYAPGVSVVLQATPAAGWRFAGWSGDAACASGTVEMTANRACTAMFVVNSISGSVVGLVGQGLALSLDYGSGTEDVSVVGSSFAFLANVPTGETYAVSITSQPSTPTQVCQVVNGSGSMPAGDVSQVLVFCGTPRYSVGGVIGGLSSPGLALKLNGGAELVVDAGSSSFVFVDAAASGSSYQVTIAQQPEGATCSIANANGTIADADITTISVTCTPLQAQLVLTLSNASDYSRYGQVVDYLVTLTNQGNGVASGVGIASTYSAAFDVPNVSWICIPGGAGSQCATSGAGTFADSVAIPAGQSIAWIVSVPVLPGSDEGQAQIQVSADGATTVTDTDTLVLYRDGFDRAYGSSSIDSVVAANAAAVLGGDAIDTLHLPIEIGGLVDDVRILRDANHEVRVQRTITASGQLVRLLARAASGAEQVSAWTHADPDAALTVASVSAPDDARWVLLHGASADVALLLKR